MTSLTDLRWKMEKYDLKDKQINVNYSKEQREQSLKKNEQHVRNL